MIFNTQHAIWGATECAQYSQGSTQQKRYVISYVWWFKLCSNLFALCLTLIDAYYLHHKLSSFPLSPSSVSLHNACWNKREKKCCCFCESCVCLELMFGKKLYSQSSIKNINAFLMAPNLYHLIHLNFFKISQQYLNWMFNL